MKLVNRIFFSVFGLVVLSTLASAVTGALLISDAVRSEAISRVELGLKEARNELENSLGWLALSAQIASQGLEGVLVQSTAADISRVFVDGLPPQLARHGLASEGVDSGILLLSSHELEALGYAPSRTQAQAALAEMGSCSACSRPIRASWGSPSSLPC